MPNTQELKKFEKLREILKLDTKWKSQEEKIQYYMNIPPKKKMEWLYQVQQFISSVPAKKRKFFLRKLKVR